MAIIKIIQIKSFLIENSFLKIKIKSLIIGIFYLIIMCYIFYFIINYYFYYKKLIIQPIFQF